MVANYFPKKKNQLVLRVFQCIYQFEFKYLKNPIVSCHSYCSSGSRNVWLLSTFSKNNRYHICAWWWPACVVLSCFSLFCVPCVASFSVFSNVYESLAGYLPKLKFKYFDTSCPEAPLKQNEASIKKNNV